MWSLHTHASTRVHTRTHARTHAPGRTHTLMLRSTHDKVVLATSMPRSSCVLIPFWFDYTTMAIVLNRFQVFAAILSGPSCACQVLKRYPHVTSTSTTLNLECVKTSTHFADCLVGHPRSLKVIWSHQMSFAGNLWLLKGHPRLNVRISSTNEPSKFKLDLLDSTKVNKGLCRKCSTGSRSDIWQVIRSMRECRVRRQL
jgi:hypothetical protein